MRKIALLIIGLALIAPLVAGQETYTTLQAYDEDACPTESARYALEIRNTADVADVYSIEVDVAWSTISEKTLEVPADSSESSYIWLQPPVNIQPGSYSFNVEATSSNTGETIEKTGTINVLSCRSVDLTAEETAKDVCRGDTATYSIEVENEGQTQESYELTTDHGALTREEVTLDPGEATTVRLQESSDETVSKDITVRAESTSSYASDESVLEFNTNKCRSMDVILSPSSSNVCGGETAEYTAVIENTGTVDDTYTVVSNAESIESSRITLAPGEERSIDIDARKERGEHSIAVQVDSTGLPPLSVSRDANLRVENCYDLRVTGEGRRINVDAANRTLMILDLDNIGTRTNTYTIGLTGPEWMDVQPFNVTVDSGDIEKAYLYAGPDFFAENGTHSATLTFNGVHGEVSMDYPVNVTVGSQFIEAKGPGSKEAKGVTGRIISQASSYGALILLFLILLIGGYLFFRSEGGLMSSQAERDYHKSADDFLAQNTNTVVKALREDSLSEDFLEILLEEEKQGKERETVLNQLRNELEK